MHRSATTSPDIRAAIQASGEPVRVLADRFGINPKTVMKWKHRDFVDDLPAGTGRIGASVLTPPEQEMCLAFRKATLLPLDDCLYALQLSLPHLSRATLHRLYRKHGISRLPAVDAPLSGDPAGRPGPIGDFYINAAPVRTGDGIVHMLVAFDRISKIAYAELHYRSGAEITARFLRNLIDAMPYRVHNTLTNDDPAFEGAAFRALLAELRIGHGFVSAETPWNIGRTASAGHATDKPRQPHYDGFEHLRSHFFAFFDTYNFERRLKALSGKTPYEYVCRCWEADPGRFRINPESWNLVLTGGK